MLDAFVAHLTGCHLRDTPEGVVKGAGILIAALGGDIGNGDVGIFDQLHSLVDPEAVQVILKVHTGVGYKQGRYIRRIVVYGFCHIGKLDILAVMFRNKGQSLLKMAEFGHVLFGGRDFPGEMSDKQTIKPYNIAADQHIMPIFFLPFFPEHFLKQTKDMFL